MTFTLIIRVLPNPFTGFPYFRLDGGFEPPAAHFRKDHYRWLPLNNLILRGNPPAGSEILAAAAGQFKLS